MDTLLGSLAVFLTAAALIESFVEYTFAKWWSGENLRYVALAVGVLVAFGFKLDITQLLGLSAVAHWIGYVATGLIIGRGSNFVNDLITRTRGGTSSSVEGGTPATPPAN